VVFGSRVGKLMVGIPRTMSLLSFFLEVTVHDSFWDMHKSSKLLTISEEKKDLRSESHQQAAKLDRGLGITVYHGSLVFTNLKASRQGFPGGPPHSLSLTG